uniref:Olfactory receptor n=1 Tax=Leptobrachium leishanense TaxID=445787 RepID=A0A8C5M8U7_9ANUR
MSVLNQTRITEFHLLGFHRFHSYKIIILFFFLLVHLLTLCGNLLIIWLVASNRSLQSPMYFFLTQLSLSDLLLTTDIVPNALYIIWNEGGAISFSGCLTQLYFFVLSDGSDCFLLTIMAYDRYVAICKPLRYNTLMNTLLCIKLIAISWLLSFSIALFDTITVSQLRFCGPNIIDHFFCDFIPLMELFCSLTPIFKVEVLLLCTLFLLFPLMIIIASYVCIVRAVLRISTESSGRVKAFSTCSSHLTVVTIFYGTLIGIYFSPSSDKSVTHSKVLSLLYTVVTPMMNPIIYSLRNKDIKEAIKNKRKGNLIIAK